MTILTVIFAILLFSLLIFVHEFGHFITAKLSGVQVNEFAIFMGPALVKWQRGETQYSIRCIPFGGYCAMEGEDGDSDNPRAFTRAAWWKRVIILVAGAFMNFVAGVLLLCVIYAPYEQYVSPVIESFETFATVDDNGLQVGDRILEVDGEKIYIQSDFSMILNLKGGDVHDLVVERGGEKVILEDLFMERHEVVNEDGSVSNMLGMSFTLQEATLKEKLRLVWNTAIDYVRTVRLSLGMLFSGQAGISDVSGPVGIVGMMVETASESSDLYYAIMNLISFGAMISVNLAVMNLLPIPALDGGRVVGVLLTTTIEAVTKKKVNPKYEGAIHAGFMILLLAFMALIMFKDVFFMFKG